MVYGEMLGAYLDVVCGGCACLCSVSMDDVPAINRVVK